jgi:hypothetical protein
LSQTAKTLAAALADEPAAAALLARLQASRDAARRIAGADAVHAAGFDPTEPGACELRDGALLLTANSAACAAKLRQGLPALQKLLQQQGLEVIELRVRIQPARMNYREGASRESSQEAAPGAVSASPKTLAEIKARLAFADKLALTLSDGPLRDAAVRLRAALRRSLTQSR